MLFQSPLPLTNISQSQIHIFHNINIWIASTRASASHHQTIVNLLMCSQQRIVVANQLNICQPDRAFCQNHQNHACAIRERTGRRWWGRVPTIRHVVRSSIIIIARFIREWLKNRLNKAIHQNICSSDAIKKEEGGCLFWFMFIYKHAWCVVDTTKGDVMGLFAALADIEVMSFGKGQAFWCATTLANVA